MMLKTQDVVNNWDSLNNKTNKLASRKIWPLPGVQDHERWARNSCLQQIINRPSQPRSRNSVRHDAFADYQGTVDNNDRESFHCAIGSILVVAQCFGLLPLSGLRLESPRKLVFKILSPRTAYVVAIMVMLFTMASISVIHMIKTLNANTFGVDGGIGAATAGAVFYSNGLIGAVLFMWLAPHWTSLQCDWRAMELFLDRDKHQSPRLRWKFSILTTIVMLFALLEHLLSIVNNTPPRFWSAGSNATFTDFIQCYCESSHAFVLSVCSYNLPIGIFIFIISKVATFTWNFTDLFVMLVSTGMAERYKSLNQRIVNKIPNQRKNVDWREFRESYATLSTMVKRIDNYISPIILLSFANNLYFICLQLLNGLSPGETTILSSVYFFGSFAFLVGRTIAVTLLAARIHDQSRIALPALYNCPAVSYNVETQRLQHQLTSDEVCLTGLKFFSITRNFMLAVAGAIVTYEVVLLQFNVAMNK